MAELITLKNIQFTYPRQEATLQGVDFTLSTGERVAIHGPNGAGKSTLFQIMVGLQKPADGSVNIFGEERKVEADFMDVRRRIGMVFQDPDDQLFCPTVFEDIAFGPLNLGKTADETQEDVDSILHCMALEHLKDRATHNLSGGEKRLVSLASVLVMQPDVLLLDEPTNALDEKTCERLVAILDGLPQAMVLISHDAAFRHRVTQKTYNLADGKLHLDQA